MKAFAAPVDQLKRYAARISTPSLALRVRSDGIWRSIAKTKRWRAHAAEPRETIAEYLARGGTVTQCPTVNLVAPDYVRPSFKKQQRNTI